MNDERTRTTAFVWNIIGRATVIGYSLTLPDIGRTINKRTNMKRTTFVGACAIVCALIVFPLAWVSSMLSIISFAIAGILGTIWLVLQHYDWANEQQKTKQYHERLKAK